MPAKDVKAYVKRASGLSGRGISRIVFVARAIVATVADPTIFRSGM